MADCLYHGQSSPGACPQCISEGNGDTYVGGYKIGTNNPDFLKNVGWERDDKPKKPKKKEKKG